MSHRFQSISEDQWRAGGDRHRCAECSLNFGHPVHCESSWPVVVVIEDCYIPEWAGGVVQQVRETPTETVEAAFHALAVYAEMKLRGAVLN